MNECKLSKSKIPFSYWDSQDLNIELKRIQYDLDYYECTGCGFESIATNYSDEFKEILYPKNFTSEALSSIEDMRLDVGRILTIY